MRSAFTQKLMGLMCEILSIHLVLPAEMIAQLLARVINQGAPA